MVNPTPAHTPIPPSGAAQSRETVRALVGEFLEKKKLEVDEAATRRAGSPRMRAVLTVVALITCALVWVAPSLYQPPVEEQSYMRMQASTRMTLFLAAERLRSYQRAHGALPRTLMEAGVDSTGIGYWRSTNTTFELTGTANGGTITYKSSMSNPEFLGTTLQILSTGR